MKISDFYAKNTEFRPQNTQILAFNNEVKETQLESKIAFLEEKTAKMNEIAEEKTLLGKQLKEQRDSNLELIQQNTDLNNTVSNLQGQVQEKERFLRDLESYRTQNSKLMVEHDTMVNRMSELRFDTETMHTELSRLRMNKADLEIACNSFENAAVAKEDLIKELTGTLTEVKQQYEGLIKSTDQLTKSYTEVVSVNQALDSNNTQLASKVTAMEKQQQNDEEKHKKEKENYGQALAQRYSGSLQRQVTELQENVSDLSKLNTHLKNELSKPQHLSVGAIARQENFKLPLASSAINYRSNNLGTDQPTLLKFSSREGTNDNSE